MSLMTGFIPCFTGCGSGGVVTQQVSNAPIRTAHVAVTFPAPGNSNIAGSLIVDPVTGIYLRGYSGTVPFFEAQSAVFTLSKFVYVNTVSNIYGFSIDGNYGAMTAVSGTPIALKPSGYEAGLAVSPDGKYLYESDATGVRAFHIDPSSGALDELSGSPFPASLPTMMSIDPSGKFIYCSDLSGTGAVDGYAIQQDGSLVALPGSPYRLGATGTSTPRPYMVLTTANALYVALAGGTGVAAFSRNSVTGVLTLMAASPYAAGTHPLGLATLEGFLYASGGPNVYGFRMDSTTGALTPLAGSPFADQTLFLTPDPNGKWMYGCAVDSFYEVTVDPNSGALGRGPLLIPYNGCLLPAIGDVAY
jgi:6-phosphogluconolactonase (cycloisomerase 2 family)